MIFQVRKKTENGPYCVLMFRVFYLTKLQLRKDYGPVNGKIFIDYFVEKTFYFGVGGKSTKF
jgi:hypothetical protein